MFELKTSDETDINIIKFRLTIANGYIVEQQFYEMFAGEKVLTKKTFHENAHVVYDTDKEGITEDTYEEKTFFFQEAFVCKDIFGQDVYENDVVIIFNDSFSISSKAYINTAIIERYSNCFAFHMLVPHRYKANEMTQVKLTSFLPTNIEKKSIDYYEDNTLRNSHTHDINIIHGLKKVDHYLCDYAYSMLTEKIKKMYNFY